MTISRATFTQTTKPIRAAWIGLALAVALAGSSAHAQNLEPNVEVGLAVGAAIPQTNELGSVDIAGGTNTGFTVAGLVQARLPGLPLSAPLSFRLEAQYARFDLDDEGRFGGGGAPVTAHGNAGVLSGTGNVVLAVPTGSRVRPYLIGGLGVYRLSSSIRLTTPSGRAVANGAPSEAETQFGLNGGAGFEVPTGAARTFVEARFHSAFAEKARFIPAVVGVRF